MVEVPRRMRRGEPDLQGQRKEPEPRAESAPIPFPLGPTGHGSPDDGTAFAMSIDRGAAETWAV
jgi:hypothetical protein